MKIKSLLLGSVAAMGLSAGAAFAADVPMVMSLGLCDGFGVWNPEKPNYEGDTHCVRVDGGASIESSWGNYRGSTALTTSTYSYNATTASIAAPDGAAGTELDWESKVEGWMRWVGIANASTGPVAAVIKFKGVEQQQVRNETTAATRTIGTGGNLLTFWGGGDDTFGVILDEAYGQALIGENLWIAGGKKSSIRNVGDDTGFTAQKLYMEDLAGGSDGVYWSAATRANIMDGGHVFQASLDAGNGLVLKASLEGITGPLNNLAGAAPATGGEGTVYGVLEYTGGNFVGHATVAAGGILDGTIESVAAHMAGTLTLDMVKLRAAAAVDSTAGVFSYNALASGQLVVNDLTFALTGEVAQFGGAALEYGAGASVSYAVSSAVTLVAAGRFYDPDSGVGNDEFWHGLGKIVWDATDTLTLTAEGGAQGSFAGTTVFYGTGTIGFDAGGTFTASASATGYSNGAFKGTLKVADTII